MPDVILGIETSCDETAAAIVIGGRDVRANVVATQFDLHARYGGVVPEIASRAHVERIEPVIREALRRAGVEYRDLSAIAVTDGPGLVGSLLVGITAAKTLAMSLDLPIVAVDHIEAHATSAALATDAQSAADTPWPAIALVASGGHTSLYLVRDFLTIELIGQTRDDAAGEAFDKVSAILEAGFPGGPAIERLAVGGDPRAIRFPRAWLSEPHANFSFSGIKTAVMYHVFGPAQKYGDIAHLRERDKANIAASFQAAVVETLVRKAVDAAQRAGVNHVVVGGGVAANGALRRDLARACAERGAQLTLTPAEYCGDNAAMIAALGFHRLRAGMLNDLSFQPRAGLRR
ncbi:MAG: tRNA (adenosine(37)-N6)-threonylcarbamoyltransferase complex transferase subunit TsaD [Phycisphaerae bacterium]